MTDLTNVINELNFLDDIDLLESHYKSHRGNTITNVSDWNPSEEFKTELLRELSINNNNIDAINYIFSYTQQECTKHSVLKNLGFTTDKSTLFTHSGSASIVNCVNLLKHLGVNKIKVLCPAYFTLFYICKLFDIECVPLYLKRENGNFFINRDELLIDRENVAFWVTNPVYCTSVYYDSSMLSMFEEILDANMVVFDESLCTESKELSHKFGNSKNFIGLYSPHKSICMNGIKFSVIISDNSFQDFLDAWADVFCGCLSIGNEIAISHYLSDNFGNYSSLFNKKIIDYKNRINKLFKETGVIYDEQSSGYLITAYFPYIDSNKGLDLNFIEDIMKNTGVRFIAGKRNHFGNDIGFCFRINLAAYNNRFYYALQRICTYLSNNK